jgi:hypothetical protein
MTQVRESFPVSYSNPLTVKPEAATATAATAAIGAA